MASYLCTISLGVGGMYITGSASNKSFDPTKWEWRNPNTISSLLQGFAMGSGIVGGIYSVHKFANTKLPESFRMLFLSGSYTIAGSVALAKMLSLEEYNAPAILEALISGVDSGIGWFQSYKEMRRGIRKLGRNSKQLTRPVDHVGKTKIQSIITVLKNPHHPLYKISLSIAMIYFMGSAANESFDIEKWKLNSFSTYEGIINGLFFGKDVSKMLKLAQIAEIDSDSTTHWKQEYLDTRNSYYAAIKHAKINHWNQFLEKNDPKSIFKAMSYTKLKPRTTILTINGQTTFNGKCNPEEAQSQLKK